MRNTIHIIHLLYRFATGGMENVIVQLINHLPRKTFRHTVVALTEADAGFAQRIVRDDVTIIELHKRPGQPFYLYPAMYRLLRQQRPDIIHTCNMAALEFMPMAMAAGVPLRIHAEHGWDIYDPDGTNLRYRNLRRLYKHFVHQFIAVSEQLQRYLIEAIGIPTNAIHFIPNGVDTEKFRPAHAGDQMPEGWPFQRSEHYVIGFIGRFEPIKNPLLLVDAFMRLVQAGRPGSERLRIAMIGEGSLMPLVRERFASASLEHLAWLPGFRGDIPELLRAMDGFVLPSLAEGTSCTLQEAMATALPIVATDVGGNSNLLRQGCLGHLVPTNDIVALSKVLAQMSDLSATNEVARQTIELAYGLFSVINRYERLFLGVAKSEDALPTI